MTGSNDIAVLAKVPKNREKERCYVLDVVFACFLGIKCRVEFEERSDIELTVLGISRSRGKMLLPDTFFSNCENRWLKQESLPKAPIARWEINADTCINPLLTNSSVPVIYGDTLDGERWIDKSVDGVHLGLDIFGSIFFMLTRYEEAVVNASDVHDRFPAESTVAFKEGFLQRPIVNEYLEILWECMNNIWPQLKRVKRLFKINLSHDVDSPFAFAFKSQMQAMKSAAGTLIRTKSIKQSRAVILDWGKVANGEDDADPHYTFDWIMDQAEKTNLTTTFFFITDSTHKTRDGDYSIYHPRIRKLLCHISSRGHNLGIHFSYNTYMNREQVFREVKIFKEVCDQEGISQNILGSRQHCLRWKTPVTFQNLEEAGLHYDTSMGFPSRSGFRCGVCYEFPVFNVISAQKLNLIERPLMTQESTVMSARYMNIKDPDQVVEEMLRYRKMCELFCGQFGFLWHNSNLGTESERKIFQSVLGLT